MITAPQSDGGFAGLFVRRPILALVLSALIIVGGLAALFGVEVRELPEVDSPVVSVRTEYPGAAPETIDREVTARIEGAAGRVPGVDSISSSSTFGRSSVTVEFTAETDIDVAANDLKDAISRVSRDLPDDIEDPRVIKSDDNAQAVLRVAVTSANLSVQELTTLVEDEVIDRLTAVPGVADVYVYGDRDNIFRIDVDQSKLASRGLNAGDIAAALSNAAFDSPAGTLTSSSQDIVVRTTAGIDTAAQFEALVIRGRTRIGDVAAVSLGPDPGDSLLRANGRTGVGMGIVRQAGSNTLEISKGVRQTVAEIAEILPDDVSIQVTSDDATFIQGSINEVLYSLLLAACIVIAIIFVFLLNLRATLVPAITLPVALIGAVGGIWLAGLSVNILTLLALVLATGLVVDDAIVVLENIVSKRNAGLGPRAAAVVGVREVFFAVITTTATLASVFIPISFLPGKVGALFGEFGFTLALSVTISSLVALTLCPMLASRFLTSAPEKSGGGPASRFGEQLIAIYSRLLRACLAAPLVVVAVSVAAALAAVVLYGTLRKELTPPEDRAVILMFVSAPQGVSLDFTSTQTRKIEALVEPLRTSGEVTNVFSIAGIRGQANNGFAVLTLAPWDERERSQQEIAAEVNRKLATVPGIRAFAIQPNSLGIRNAGEGLKVALLGDDYDELAAAAEELMARMEADPRFGRIRLSYETTQPQLSISIDRERASDLGINIDGLAPVVQAMLDGRSVGSVFVGDRAVDVKMISTSNPINDPSDLEDIFLKASDGRTVPLSSISTLEEKAVAPSLGREQRRRAVTLTASLDGSFSIAGALAEAQQLAAPLLPAGARLAPLAEAATLKDTESGMRTTFLFAIVVVLLVLAAQFESFVSALIIMLTVPLGLACAVFALVLTGTSLNVYSQIGLVLLVGIMAKNGILMVEFANQLRNSGMSVADAAEQAAIRRVRPIMMTMVSTVLGAIPLVLASGAGAEARVALGWVIAGGLGLATTATLFVTPVAYRLLAGLSSPAALEEERLRQELNSARSETA
ncbi:efflux RND transporter permease subunit [Salaquimonas pukyongi]|uniref:efflux RND transporter permease subunit n=1 Tax=Salaquimonas pukyongi TaxID=2712698 RepID=UPI00096BC7BD|nr:efflux RND transporter permease subunit [Salaquimonas pukyongi]